MGIPFALPSAPSVGAQDLSPAAAAVSTYLENIETRDWDGAYQLTSTDFQSRIPFVAFRQSMEISHIAEGLSSFRITETDSGNGVADVQAILTYSVRGRSETGEPVSFRVLLQADDWRVELPVADFLAAKLDMQEALAQVAYEGVLVSVHYILIYPASESVPPETRVRLDIENQDSRTLQWELPRQSDSNNYVTDLSTGSTFSRQASCGIMAKKDGGFSVDAVKDGPYVITAAPGSKGAVFLEFTGMPETVGKMNITLSGFSFVGDNGNWGVVVQDVPPTCDVAPMQ
jgi:hypothetical protein